MCAFDRCSPGWRRSSRPPRLRSIKPRPRPRPRHIKRWLVPPFRPPRHPHTQAAVAARERSRWLCPRWSDAGSAWLGLPAVLAPVLLSFPRSGSKQTPTLICLRACSPRAAALASRPPCAALPCCRACSWRCGGLCSRHVRCSETPCPARRRRRLRLLRRHRASSRLASARPTSRCGCESARFQS